VVSRWMIFITERHRSRTLRTAAVTSDGSSQHSRLATWRISSLCTDTDLIYRKAYLTRAIFYSFNCSQTKMFT
jgi:hypothetical protein